MEELISAQEIADSSGGRLIAADPRVVALAVSVGAAVRRYCRWHIAPIVKETRIFDTNGGTLLQLPTLKLREISSFKILGRELDVAQLEWSELGSVRVASLPRRFRSVEVTFTHGYDRDEVMDVVGVAAQVARMAASSPMGVIQESLGSRSMTLAQLAPGIAGGISLLERDLAILNAYRLETKP